MSKITPGNTHHENDVDRLRRSTTSDAMSVELVLAFAGDREMTEAEQVLVQEKKEKRGNVFYSDLFYAICHIYFAPEIAADLWDKVLIHKHTMSERLGRNIRIIVATLDYLSNITTDLRAPTLISETYITQIATLSMRDGMTGLYNHSSCYELLDLELRTFRRYGVCACLILLDIDDFKAVNDSCGHQEGDRVLIEFAKTMDRQVRDSDICCRFGGEEFVVILPFTANPGEAGEIAERIRSKAMNITYGGKRITISAGVAVCDQDTNTAQALIDKADRALYKAKRQGKNQVVLGVR